MRRTPWLLGTLMTALAIPVHGAKHEAAPEKAAACTACHGGNGISVSPEIPNLAGQKRAYLEAQLKAFRDETRKNPLMNAMAKQLSDADIERVTAWFSSLAAGAESVASAVGKHIGEPRIEFPADYQQRYTRYTTIDFDNRKQVRHYYANEAALRGARAGGALPEGSMLFVEVYKAKLDADGKPAKDANGRFIQDDLAAYTAMEKRQGWGEGIPAELRNGDWSYAVFTAQRTPKPGTNYATCFACHKPLAEDDYVFSIQALREQAGP